MPVATLTVGLEGIEAEPERDVLVADTPVDFTTSVVRALQDTELQGYQATNGRRLAKRRFH